MQKGLYRASVRVCKTAHHWLLHTQRYHRGTMYYTQVHNGYHILHFVCVCLVVVVSATACVKPSRDPLFVQI